jgi:hypothetical protein
MRTLLMLTAMAALSASVANAAATSAPDAGIAIATATVSAASDDQTKVYQRLLSRYGRTVVMVNYVLSFENAGGAADQRTQGETEATLVSKDGLLIVPSAVLNPTDMFQKIYRNAGDGQMPNMRSSEIKVRLPGSDEPLEAQVITQDRDLGVAWLKIKLPPSDLEYVDLGKALDPIVGQKAYVVGVIAEEFDYAPFLDETRIQGKIEVPYKAFIADQPGKMLFDANGRPIGFAVLRIDGTANMSAGGNYRMFATVVGGARLKDLQERVRKLVK